VANGSARPVPKVSWNGVLRDSSGKTVPGATVVLRNGKEVGEIRAETSSSGAFALAELVPGSYQVTVIVRTKTWRASEPVTVVAGHDLSSSLRMTGGEAGLQVLIEEQTAKTQASGGEKLSSNEVSSLPLNERDFSKLLLLAAGTMTDANGAANFTQQFAVNGQRGTASVFAMDGADTTDSELGGATFPNFNVDAILEVQSSSGVMPAEIGHGAAGFTNVVTRSGGDQVHGSVFEFIRNAAFDARNFFDHIEVLDLRRIPPFIRNEFGGTNGGPLVLPGFYDGKGKTYYFAEYQGFRQVLGTTQVIPVPTAAERQGIDTSAFPGDTLTVPVSPAVAPLLARYPLPNEPGGPFGARTYATSSKIVTNTDQFSVRVDHRISDKASLMGRFSLNQVNGPITNPDQTTIDPSFGVKFFDHQRNATIKFSRTFTPRLSFAISIGYIRSTPFFPAVNHIQPNISYGDGLYQGFNTPDGSIFGSFGNLYQAKHDMVYTRGTHSGKWGVEVRWNKDATIFGTNPNGAYTFGGGPAYSPVFIPSASGKNDIHPGDRLPDALSGLLTATPYSYTITALDPLTPGGNKFDEAGVRREAYNFYVQDTWKPRTGLSLTYGLRYEINTRIKEAKHRTSSAAAIGADGKEVSFLAPGAREIFLYNPQPPYPMDWNGWGPRFSVDYAPIKHTAFHAGVAETTLLPNLWQENFVTGGFPLIFQPVVTAKAGVPVPFRNTVVQPTLPQPLTLQGQLLFAGGSTASVAPNTQIDLQRYQDELAAITPGHEVQLFLPAVIAKQFRNGYIGTCTLGLDQDLGTLKFSASYVGTAGVHLPSVLSPNGYQGAAPAFAPFTKFNAAGDAVGGFGPELVMTSGSHSTYHALQTSLTESQSQIGLSFQASYTFSKSIDDTSAVLGGGPSNAGVILQTLPQNPQNPEADRGPSTFDVTHVFALSLIQAVRFDRVGFLRSVSRKLTSGWQILSISTITSGSPFSVYSGAQQTAAGSGGTDRPDLVQLPNFSTSRAKKEDYFGRGPANNSFFVIPVGRFGTLGRNTFRGPHFRDVDLSVIKDTSFGRRNKTEAGILQFRAEFFNILNFVNFGLPSNIVSGSGFGIISRTAGSSRQIQFSLKLIY
jgi:hypothetical protein